MYLALTPRLSMENNKLLSRVFLLLYNDFLTSRQILYDMGILLRENNEIFAGLPFSPVPT